MRYGVYLPSGGPLASADVVQRLCSVAQAAEALGFDSVWVGDHTLFPLKLPPKDDGSKFSFDPEEPYLEPLTALAYVAAITRKVRLGTAALVLPTRNPVLTAKAAATLDVLSGGRLILGVAAGWLQAEFGLLQVPFRLRGRMTDEAIAVIKELWTSEAPRFEGRFYRFADCRCEPRPLQKPHPPIWIGGESDAALRRVVRCGNGWLARARSPGEYAGRLAVLRETAAAAGRGLSGITLSVSPRGKPVDAMADDVEGFRVAGAQHLWITATAYSLRFPEVIPALERFAARVGLR